MAIIITEVPMNSNFSKVPIQTFRHLRQDQLHHIIVEESVFLLQRVYSKTRGILEELFPDTKFVDFIPKDSYDFKPGDTIIVIADYYNYVLIEEGKGS